MQPLYLLGLASRHAQWTTLRQAAIAGNIANANTPGYQAMDVAPFSAVLDKTRLDMARTDGGHLEMPAADAIRQGHAAKAGKDGWDTTLSGNSVSLEAEMLKADEVNRAYSLDTTIMRTFHRMLLTSVKT